MKHNIINIKSINQLSFDDDIESNTINASYTHWNEGQPMFLIGIKRPDKSIDYSKGEYVKGLKNLKDYMFNHANNKI